MSRVRKIPLWLAVAAVLAFVVPFEYQRGKWSPDLTEAFWSALENKSDELSRELDGSVSIDP